MNEALISLKLVFSFQEYVGRKRLDTYDLNYIDLVAERNEPPLSLARMAWYTNWARFPRLKYSSPSFFLL